MRLAAVLASANISVDWARDWVKKFLLFGLFPVAKQPFHELTIHGNRT
jgi:hypothetical protein